MYNKKLLIKDNIGIIDALRQLDETAEKVLFVVDNDTQLLGTLTDGDVRRSLLNGKSLKDTISEIYNKNPKFLYDGTYSREKAKKICLKYKTPLLPITDRDNKLINVISWEKIFSDGEHKAIKRRKKIHVPVVIMAGGKGTRLDPFTKILPKPLIPIGDKPIIELIIDKFREYGMDDFYITLNHRSKMIKAYFEEFKTKYHLTYIDEKEPLGTAGSLKYLPSKITGSFFVSNSDIIIEEDYPKILKFHEGNGNDITIVASVKDYIIPYGVCEIENGGVLSKISEKPNFSFLVNTGMYVVDSGVVPFIPAGQFYQFTQLIEEVKSRGRRIGVFPISEKSWIDIGEWEMYKQAMEKFGSDR